MHGKYEKSKAEHTESTNEFIFSKLNLFRLKTEGICTEDKLPSVSSINRIVRSSKCYGKNPSVSSSSSKIYYQDYDGDNEYDNDCDPEEEEEEEEEEEKLKWLFVTDKLDESIDSVNNGTTKNEENISIFPKNDTLESSTDESNEILNEKGQTVEVSKKLRNLKTS